MDLDIFGFGTPRLAILVLGFGFPFFILLIKSPNPFGFGLPLGSEANEKGGMIYSLKSSLSCYTTFNADMGIKIYPVFGQTNATTITSGWGAAANLLTGQIILPYKTANISNSTTQTRHILTVDEDVLVVPSYTVSNNLKPLMFGWVFENCNTATALFINALVCDINIQKYNSDMGCYSALGR